MLFVISSKAFDSIHKGKMEQILLAYEIPKETVNAIMMLYKNTRAKVCLPDGDTDFFDILVGVLQGDTLAPFIFIICLHYVLCTSVNKIKHLGLTLTKARSRTHPAVTITDADFADDLALMAGVQTLLHSLETASGDTGLYVNAKKTEYMSYNQIGTMHTLSSDDIKSVSFSSTLAAMLHPQKLMLKRELVKLLEICTIR